jgi:hypothetical protein
MGAIAAHGLVGSVITTKAIWTQLSVRLTVGSDTIDWRFTADGK